MAIQNAQVIFPVNLARGFDYQVPDGLRVQRGDFVHVPLGHQIRLGVITGLSESRLTRTLKPIVERIDAPGLSETMLDFINWTANYNCVPVGMVLRMTLSSRAALFPSPVSKVYHLAADFEGRFTVARAAICERGGPFPASASQIATRAQVSTALVRHFADKGGLMTEERAIDAPFARPQPDFNPTRLTAAQQQAAEDLCLQVRKQNFNVSLLDGVTGSGKTEVYFEAVAESLRLGRQILVLVPEISLTQSTLLRFQRRFGVAPAAWHSALSPAHRRRVWREVAHGRAALVIGARSGLYLPFDNLGLIIVDEEHDSTYKQEEGVIYNARDMAVVRAKLGRHAVILSSATPALESLHNARQGRYGHVRLPERPGMIRLPPIHLIDLKVHPPEAGKFLSEPLREAVEQGLGRGEQSLLYLNRRGYAPLIICRICGEKLKSPDTDSWLVAHRRNGLAMCHLSGFTMPIPQSCPSCHSLDGLHLVGPGVERIAEELGDCFPQARIEIFSSDTMNSPQIMQQRMTRMAAGDIDILVGTQMVVKGHNFPNLTLVGVVDGDLMLAGGDLRAGERSYQTLVQVAGRAGRVHKPGQAMIQTHQPEHEALVALEAGNRDVFINAELAMREMLGLPPYGRLAAIILSGADEPRLEALARTCAMCAPRIKGVEIFGPSIPPVSCLRGRYRRRFLVQARLQINLSAFMYHWRERVHCPGGYRLHIDIDPQNFM